MNKNMLLGVVVVLGIGIVGTLLFFSPENSVDSIKSFSKTQQLLPQQEQDINVFYHEKNQKNSAQIKKQISKNIQKVDPTIKAATIDHYSSYLIQLIDKNPEDKNLKLENKPGTYTYIEGKVNGKQYVLKVPKSVLDKPGIKIRVTDLKTKKITEIDASFLSEVVSLPEGSTFRANINTRNPENIQTSVELPEENPPFPTLRK